MWKKYGAAIPSEDIKILEFNQCQKSDKAPSIIYADLKSLIKKVKGSKTDAGNLSTTKVGKHVIYGYSMSTIWTFDGIEHKDDGYRIEDKLKDYFYYTGKNRDIPAVFQKGSNDDYHFIIKELVKRFEGEFNCLEENTGKYKIFSVPVAKGV